MLVNVALGVVVEMAVHAARARRNLVDLSIVQLVDVVWVNSKRTRHEVEVSHALYKRVLEVIRRMSRVHIRDGTHRNRNGRLELAGNAEHHTSAAMLSEQLALPVTLKVKLRTIGRSAVNAVPREIEVAGKLAHMHTERPQAHVQGIGTGSLEALGDFEVLLHRGHERGVAQVGVVLLDTVDEHLHGKVLPAGLLDALNHLAYKAGTILKALGTILVIALVAHAREERLANVVARSVDLNSIPTKVLKLLGKVGRILLEGMNLIDRHIASHGRGKRTRSRLLRAAKRNTHARDLVTDVTSLFVNRIGKFLQRGSIHGHAARHGEVLILVHKVLDPHHIHPAVGKGAIVGHAFFVVLARIGACGRLHDTVLNLETAKLPRRKQRSEIGSVGTPSLSRCSVLLSVHLRRSNEALSSLLGPGLHRRIRGTRYAGKCHQSASNRSTARNKAAPRHTCIHIMPPSPAGTGQSPISCPPTCNWLAA